MSLLSFDGEPTEETAFCADCGAEHTSVTGFVLDDGAAHAVYFAAWHPGRSEAYVDIILGSFDGPRYDDNVTFGCRIGHVASQAAPACSLVTGGATRSDHPLFGRKLDRAEALAHPRLDELWTVVDWLVVNDRLLHEKVFHMPDRDS